MKHTLLTIFTWFAVIAIISQTQFGLIIVCLIATIFFIGETIVDAVKRDMEMKHKHKHKQNLGR